MPSTCKEIVIYEVKRDSEAQFLALHEKISAALKTQSGFISHNREKALDHPHRYIDMVTWDSYERAKAAFLQFKNLPLAAEFMASIERVIYSGHFELMDIS